MDAAQIRNEGLYLVSGDWEGSLKWEPTDFAYLVDSFESWRKKRMIIRIRESMSGDKELYFKSWILRCLQSNRC